GLCARPAGQCEQRGCAQGRRAGRRAGRDRLEASAESGRGWAVTRIDKPIPRILITNDDGSRAEGLKVLEQIAAELSDDVWVVVPEHDQSGVSHSISLHTPLRIYSVSDRYHCVNGTPADC